MREQLHWPTLEQRRKQARLTNCRSCPHHGLNHIESKHCPSPTDRPKRTTRHTHDLTYDVPSHRTDYRQKTFFHRTIPERNSLLQVLSHHSTHPWPLCDQGLLLARSLTSINKKWVSEGWSYGGRTGLAGYSKVVNALHTYPAV